MKKILLLSVSLLLIMVLAFGFVGCKGKKGDGTKSYTLDTAEFNSTAVFGEELSLKGLKLVEEKGDTLDVTAEMTDGIDTSSAGAKSFTVSYNGQTFTVDYTVKFRVTYMVEGVETVQLVSDVGEIVVPETPKISGKQFDCWSVQLPNVLTSNLRIDAIYKTLSGAREDAYTWTGNGVISLEGYVTRGGAVNVSVKDEEGNALSGVTASVDAGTGRLNYSLGELDGAVITISGEGVAVEKSWRVSRTTKPTLTIADGQEAVGFILSEKKYPQKISTGASVKLKYVIEYGSGKGNLKDVQVANGHLFVETLKLGVTELIIKAVNATNELEYVTVKQYVVVTPESFAITNDSTEFGIEDIWTVAKDNASGLTKLSVYAGAADKIGEGFLENLSFTTGNANVAVSADGTITLSGSSSTPDIVNVKASFGYKGVVAESLGMQIRCVYDGVNVYSYDELWAETQKAEPRPIVLQSSIKDDFSTTNFTWMKSTYDLTYYENIYGKGTQKFNDETRVKVLVQFKNDVYGNGYEINAHNATLGMLDSTGKPTANALFKGPLNFVAMSQTAGAISVKGQDNIVFGVYEGVTLNNVVLKSCDLTAHEGVVDLTELEYAGTTVEVLGDGVTIEYSRLINGRTVLRVFGDAHDAEKEISVEVRNTLIKGSREFNARIGSNRFVDGTASDNSPNLSGDTGEDYNAKKKYNDQGFNKTAYDDKYINTFVTFENVIFEDAGIFSIALDAHFSGPALHDGSGFVGAGILNGWKDLAKTSYGAKVTLKDDVRLYSWKPLEDIDSSTLMENNFPNNDAFSAISLDLKSLVAKVAKTPTYSNLLYNYGGVDYIHAGIVFFGGGKNYSVIETAITSDFNHAFQSYEVALSDEEVGQGYLENAAGKQPFYFFIYDKSGTFTYETQLNLKDKYSCLKK